MRLAADPMACLARACEALDLGSDSGDAREMASAATVANVWVRIALASQTLGAET